MHRFSALRWYPLALLVAALTITTAGCGGGGGGREGGDKLGEDTAPQILGLQTPGGLQGTRGVSPDLGWVQILYSIRDAEYDTATVEIEYRLYNPATKQVMAWMPATAAPESYRRVQIPDPANPGMTMVVDDPYDQYPNAPVVEVVPGHDGTGPLNASPGPGALHSFVWDSQKDIGTGRYVIQDYVYTDDGRVALDAFGDARFEAFPGVEFRVRATSTRANQGEKISSWESTNPFSVNNNRTPAVTITGVVIPPEGADDNTVNEDVIVEWRAIDPDGDTVTIAVDYFVLEDENQYVGMSPEEIAALDWRPATASSVGDGTLNLPASDAPGVDHEFGWSSLEDAQQVKVPVLVRMRPLDGKREVGDWVYAKQHFNLDNLTTFLTSSKGWRDPASGEYTGDLPEGRIGARALTLDTGDVLITGGSTSAADAPAGTKDAFAYYTLKFEADGVLNKTATLMGTARAYHTATLLLPGEPANPGDPLPPSKVLLVGGFDANGDPVDTAEIYDPATDSFSSTNGTMASARAAHVAVLLRSGKVLIASGVKDASGNAASYLDSAEIFDPVSGTFEPLSVPADTDMESMRAPRAYARGVILPAAEASLTKSDRSDLDLVLIAGGRDENGSLASIEMFDALVGGFIDADNDKSMNESRYDFTLTPTLSDSFAAVAAGGLGSPPRDTIELFDAATREWTLVGGIPMVDSRANHTALLLGDGRVLLAGGQTDEMGSLLTATADIFSPAAYAAAVDPKSDGGTAITAAEAAAILAVPHGGLMAGSRNSAATVLNNGRAVFFGGETTTGASKDIQIYAPDSEGGFNFPPTLQLQQMSGKVEPWAFGIRLLYRLLDKEGDPARIVVHYKVDDAAGNPAEWQGGGSRHQDLGKWLPATMLENTVLDDRSSGTTNLVTMKGEYKPTAAENPIDLPDSANESDRGEHLFVWNAALDVPKGDYAKVFLRITAYGAVQGERIATDVFGLTKNAPVIMRILDPIAQTIDGKPSVHGNVVIPFYVQDSDSNDPSPPAVNDLARVEWFYGIDLDNDGRITELRDAGGNLIPGSERWAACRQAAATETIASVDYVKEDMDRLVSSRNGNPDPVTGIAWGERHYFVWDSVYDLGAPLMDASGKYRRSDVLIRAQPYDYADPGAGNPVPDESTHTPGIEQSYKGFWKSQFTDPTDPDYDANALPLERDPEGLWLDRWYPIANQTAGSPYRYNGVKLDEGLRFEFTTEIDLDSANADTLIVKNRATGGRIAGYYHSVNSGGRGIVTFYPQVQEVPARTDVLTENTGYSIEIPAYDPENRAAKVIQKKDFVGSDDTNQANLLTETSEAYAFLTGTGAVMESIAPAFASLDSPSDPNNVPTNTSEAKLRFNERLAASTVILSNLEAYAEVYAGVKSVVPGTVSLINRTRENAGVVEHYSVLTFSLLSGMTLPPATTIKLAVKTGVTDLYGNALAGVVTQDLVTVAATATKDGKLEEQFTSDANRDKAATTAWWGTYAPPVPGSFASQAKSGYLKGLFAFGSGGDGAKTISGTEYWYPGDSAQSNNKTEWQFTSLSISGNLYIRGKSPVVIRVQGPVNITGRIYAYGSNGISGAYFASTGTSQSETTGYAGGANGAARSGYASTTTILDGSAGKGTGAGKGGGGYLKNFYQWYAVVTGGGGAGHAAAGTVGGKGYDWLYLTPGAGGSAYGNAALTNGPEGGSGGGSGGNVISTYYGNFGVLGGAGGAGGGAFAIVASDKITLGSSSILDASGGAGGSGYYYYYSYYNCSGGGGGGSGGSIELAAPDMSLGGTVDLEGGSGGNSSDPFGGTYSNKGGDGAGGRVVIGTSAAMWMVNGVISSGTASVVVSGSYTTDWTVSNSVTVNTDTGSNGIGYNSASGEFRVRNFTLPAGVTMTLAGKKPLKIIASGNVDIKGKIAASGGSGPDMLHSSYSYLSGSGTWKIWYDITYTPWGPGPLPGVGVAGGGDGGSNGASKTYTYSIYGYYSHHDGLDIATDGVGFDGKIGGTGSGSRGRAKEKSYLSYLYYYYGGAGSGGNSATIGTDGWNQTHSLYGGGTSGTAKTGSSNLADLGNLTPFNVHGGAGGGGGPPGGRRFSTSSGFRYPFTSGAGGGAGGGGIGIAAKGTVNLAGTIEINGGAGGGFAYSTFGMWGGAGGGGGGGLMSVHSDTGISFGLPILSADGGVQRWMQSYSWTYTFYRHSIGGAGGRGAIRLTQSTSIGAPALPSIELDPSNLKLGKGGSVSGKEFAVDDTAISKWLDSGAVAPYSFKGSPSGSGIGKVFFQGAQSHPATGEADPMNTSGDWQEVGSGSSTNALDGFRYYRFKIVLTGVPGSFPEVDSFTTEWQYDT